jgi:antitoxin CptB
MASSLRIALAAYATRRAVSSSSSSPFVAGVRYVSDQSQTIPKIEAQRRRLLHQANNRGMKENDIILGTFAAKYLPTMSQEDLDQFDTLVQQIDPDIWGWLTKAIEIPAELQTPIMHKLQTHMYSNPLNYQLTK